MKIYQISTSKLQENSYFLEENKEAILIDAGSDSEKILNILKENKLTLKFILITHGHFDHTSSIKKLREETKCIIYMSKKDIGILYGTNEIPDEDLKDKEEIIFNNIKIKAISTPGHTAGSFCFYITDENIIFTGDTLFKQAIGRTDLPSGSKKEMRNSLKKLFELPENTLVYPGHGEKTTIKEEKN